MQQPTLTRSRIHSIDILRGIVMIIMAIDHARDFFHKVEVSGNGAVATGPTDLATTTPILFFTRWITHFCAPSFVFLAGVSAYLMSTRKTKSELSSFLIKRGIWLVLVEIIIVTLGWTFNPLYNILILQVIWAIGASMIILGLLVWVPYKAILAIGIIIVAGHNLLDYPAINAGLKGHLLPDLLYFSTFSTYAYAPGHLILIVYAFLPWTGIMLLGYCFGKLYAQGVDPLWRRKMLVRMGWGTIALFVLLRFINVYGDPLPWSVQPRGTVFSFLSFINVNKYPPSLQFICVTLGVAMLMLASLERAQNSFTRIMNVYGRVPMFYYILHFYLLHILVVITFYASGFTNKDISTPNNPFLFRPSAFGFPLWGVYAVWLLVVITLYPLCKKYDQYKSSHKNWWLSYL